VSGANNEALLTGTNEVATNAFDRFSMYLLWGVGKSGTLVNSKGNIGSCVVSQVVEHTNDGSVIETPLIMRVAIVVGMQDSDSRG
jgi:hypothetical protein